MAAYLTKLPLSKYGLHRQLECTYCNFVMELISPLVHGVDRSGRGISCRPFLPVLKSVPLSGAYVYKLLPYLCMGLCCPGGLALFSHLMLHEYPFTT